MQEILSRPALNGGWDRLAQQQDEQCDRLKSLEARFDRLDRWGRWLAGAVGTIAVSVLGRLLYDMISRIQVVLH